MPILVFTLNSNPIYHLYRDCHLLARAERPVRMVHFARPTARCCKTCIKRAGR